MLDSLVETKVGGCSFNFALFGNVNWQGLSFDTATVVALDVNTIPEPSSCILFGLGAVGLFAMAGRRRNA